MAAGASGGGSACRGGIGDVPPLVLSSSFSRDTIVTTLDESYSSVLRRPVKGCGGGSTRTSAVKEEESLLRRREHNRSSSSGDVRRSQQVDPPRQVRMGRRGWRWRRWVEVATSTGAAIAAADGEGGSSLGEMVDSSKRVRVYYLGF